MITSISTNLHRTLEIYTDQETFKKKTLSSLVNLSDWRDRLVGLVVKGSASSAENPGFESRLSQKFFRGRVIPVTSKLALQWLPCQASGVIGSVLGLVGPVSVYCDWVRWKVWSATSISVWQHVQLSEQIRP